MPIKLTHLKNEMIDMHYPESARNSRTVGFIAEQLAVDFLIEHQLEIIQRNFHCKLGEIDIIAFDANALVFIEVRYRKNTHYGTPAESVTYGKKRKIIQAARYFLMKNRTLAKLTCRFDVIAVTIGTPNPKIEWIKHAFY